MSRELRSIIQVSIGAASMCWSEIPTGVFESRKADQLTEAILIAVESEQNKQLKEIAVLKEENTRLKYQQQHDEDKKRHFENFKIELRKLINAYSIDNFFNTPDFELAKTMWLAIHNRSEQPNLLQKNADMQFDKNKNEQPHQNR